MIKLFKYPQQITFMKNYVVPAIIAAIIIIAVIALLIGSAVKPATPASVQSALIAQSESAYNAARTSGGFKLGYKIYFVNTSNGQQYNGNYSFQFAGNGFNMSLYSFYNVLPNVEKIMHANASFNGVKLSDCTTKYFTNTSSVNSTLISAIDKSNANSTSNCSVPITIPSGINPFNLAYLLNTLPTILYTPIDGSTIYYASPQSFYANSTITPLGVKTYIGQSCEAYNTTFRSYPENVTFIECISIGRVGLPLSVLEESGNQVLMSTNITSFEKLNIST